MSAIDFMSSARADIDRLEGLAARGRLRRDARAQVARITGIAPGTLENIRRGRAKRIGADVMRRLDAALVAALRREIGALDAELRMARARALAAAGPARLRDLDRAASALATARAALADGLTGEGPDGRDRDA